MRYLQILALLFAAATFGCGGEGATSVEVEAPNAQIQAALADVAESGQIDSGIMLVREQLEMMRETEAAKADDLLKDLDALEGMSSPGSIKAKAKEMLSKL